MAAEFASKTVSPIILAEFFFDSGTLRMWTGHGDLEWKGQVFTGGGAFIGISAIDETQDTEAKGIYCSLNGIPSELIALTLLERSRGRKMRLYVASVTTERFVATESDGIVMTESDAGRIILENNLVDEPYRIFQGIMDTIDFTDSGSTANIRISVENVLIIGQRTKIERYTTEDQKKRFPDDKSMDLINNLQDKAITW